MSNFEVWLCWKRLACLAFDMSVHRAIPCRRYSGVHPQHVVMTCTLDTTCVLCQGGHCFPNALYQYGDHGNHFDGTCSSESYHERKPKYQFWRCDSLSGRTWSVAVGIQRSLSPTCMLQFDCKSCARSKVNAHVSSSKSIPTGLSLWDITWTLVRSVSGTSHWSRHVDALVVRKML